MKRILVLVFLILIAPPVRSGDKEAPVVPARYKAVLQTKKTRLVEFLGSPEQPPAFGHNAALSADGKFALFTTPGVSDPDTSQTNDSLLTYWNVDNAQIVKEITVAKQVVTALALHGKIAVAGQFQVSVKGEQKSRIAVWDLAAGKELHSIPVDTSGVASVAIALDGRTGLASTVLGKLLKLDLDKGKATVLKETKDVRMFDVAFDKTGGKAVSAWNDELKLWDVANGKELKAFKGQREWILSAALSPEAKFAAAFAGDEQVKMWDTATGKEVGTLKKGPFNSSLVTLAFVGEDKVALAWSALDPLTGMQDQSFVSLWDGKKEVWTQKTPLKGLAPLLVQGERLLVGGGANPFYLFNLADGTLEKIWGGHKGAVTALSLDKKGRLLSAGQDGSFLLWDQSRSRQFLSFKDTVGAAAIPNQGGLHGLSGTNHTIRLFDPESGKIIKQFTGHTGQVTSLAMHGDFLASAGADRTVKLWRFKDEKEKNTLTGHGDAVNAVAFSPSGDWLSSGGDDNTVRLWDLKAIGDKKTPDEEDSKVLEEHKRQVTCLLWSKDDMLFSGSQDMTIKLWDPSKGKVVRAFQGHKNWITSLIVVGNYLISASDDLTVRLWDINSGKEIDRIDLGASSDGPRSLLHGPDNTFYVGTAGWAILRFAIPGEKK